MSPNPDEVDVHHCISTELIGEEMHPEVSVSRQQRKRRGQDREDGDDQDIRNQRRPGENWHLHQGQAWRPHAQDSDNEIDAS
ncbi:hypothetical protein D3C72_2362050 [compost metagenome]